ITQPTLSRQIAELEEEVGTPLFVRSNRNVTLTDAGVLLRRRVEELLALERKIKDEFMAKENIGGTVSIVWQKRHPRIRPRILSRCFAKNIQM
ncbi:MAG TPA: hypothetical protein DEF06_05215, partial [Clostridiales bacterium]|nr:hypothetical protein [Clostridiales bacterium]